MYRRNLKHSKGALEYAACFVVVLPKLRKSDGTQEAQAETHLMQAREGMTSCATIRTRAYLSATQ
jgi:hypothetical protein